MFSQNWQKDSSQYAPIKDRMEMARILQKHYPNKPFVMTDIEDQLGTHLTCEVLQELKRRFPENNFMWVMGADSLASFHTWKNYENIIRNFPIVVVGRPPYTNKALSSPAAMQFQFLRVSNPEKFKEMGSGWFLLDVNGSDMSSSGLLRCLRNNQTIFDGPFQEVANYIFKLNLYGCRMG